MLEINDDVTVPLITDTLVCLPVLNDHNYQLSFFQAEHHTDLCCL